MKGQALLLAIDTGLIQINKTTRTYNIAPFMKFWDMFSITLDRALKDGIDIRCMLNEDRENSTDHHTSQGN